MTDSVLAVCATAHELGVTEVVVADSHGNGLNVQHERMPDYVQLVRSWPRPLGMMQGIEIGKYVGAALIGYHASGTNPNGILSHTFSSEYPEIRLNGKVVSEAAFSAALAGHFSVPILMIAGDDAFVAETRELIGEVPSATLKLAYSSTSAISPSLNVSATRLREATRAAFQQIGKIEPFQIGGPVDIQLQLRTRSVAEWLSYLPEVERTGALSIRYRATDIVAASRFVIFVTFAKAAFS
jgi:D-amino peptidase